MNPRPRFTFQLDDDATPDANATGDQLSEANYRAACLARETDRPVVVTDHESGDSWTVTPDEARIITEAAQDDAEECPCEFHRAMRAAEAQPHDDAPSVPTLAQMAAFLATQTTQEGTGERAVYTAPDLASVIKRASYVAPFDPATRH